MRKFKNLYAFFLIFVCWASIPQIYSQEFANEYDLTSYQPVDCYSIPDILSSYYSIPAILSLQVMEGEGRSYERGYSTAGMLVALYKKLHQDYFFLDLKAHRVEDGKFAGNCGLGWRTYCSFLNHMIGTNIYYDYRHLTKGNLQELGVGVELLNSCWDVRGNFYWPIGKKRVLLDTKFYDYSDGLFAREKNYKSAMWGVDLEVGKNLFCIYCFNFYGTVGPYFYSSSSCCNSFIGGLSRFEVYLPKYLFLGFQVTYDCLFRMKYQGIVNISIPLGSKIDCWQYLFQPVKRNDIIVAEKICCWKQNF